MDISECREKIDAIDKALIEKLDERMRVAESIADYKKGVAAAEFLTRPIEEDRRRRPAPRPPARRGRPPKAAAESTVYYPGMKVVSV